MPRFRRAVLGGTFDRLHAGHRRLLRAAFAAASEVRIGLTSPGYLAGHPKAHDERIQPYAARKAGLERWIREHYPGRRWRIARLDDPFGGSVRPGPDLLVVSEETRRGARAVNRQRRRRGLAPLSVRVVRMVRDRSGLVVRSRRFRARDVPGRPRPPRPKG